MTIEEKAKAYDIALDKIKRLLGTGSNCSREDLEYVFPELAESEDERIRKHLIGVVELYYGNTDEQEKKDCLAWLEKQKNMEVKLIISDEGYNKAFQDGIEEVLTNPQKYGLEKQGEHANFRNKIQIGDEVTRNEDGVLVNLSQLKRVAKKDDMNEFEKFLKENNYEDDLEFQLCDLEMAFNAGKELQWKPTGEQMEYLAKAITTLGDEGNCKTASILNDLRVELKKLMEE